MFNAGCDVYSNHNQLIKALSGLGIMQEGINSKANSGFTIVELLVSIVIIAVLGAIVIVSYTGITSKANEAAMVSDLSNAKKQLSIYYAEYNVYPTSLDGNKCPSAPKADTNYCLKSGNGTTFVYNGGEDSFNLTLARGGLQYGVSNDSSPLNISQPSKCPTGFIPVPGSATFNTKGFCIMKYEAKDAGSNVPVSAAAGLPWVHISQTNAMAYSSNIAGCTGCHLITEAERMTLVQNILSVNTNWSGGTVGSGYVYSGHSDNAPASSLAASTNDTLGYNGTGQSTGYQRRTLTLTNGEIIWDLSGNVWEWTSGQTTGGQPGVSGLGYGRREWPSLNNPGSLAVSLNLSGIGLNGAETWDRTNGIGRIYSSSNESGLRSFIWGGAWDEANDAGLMCLALDGEPSFVYPDTGFRVAAPAQ